MSNRLEERGPRSMDLSAIKIGKRVRHEMGDIAGLAANIAELGLMHPIVVHPDGRLIAGERRIRAFRELGRSSIPVTVLDLDRVVRGEYAENFFRKAFAPSEMADIADALEPVERAAAKQRQVSTLKHGSRPGKIPERASEGRALDHIAKIVGKDRKTIAKARAVCDAAKKSPEKFGKLKAAMDRTGLVDGAFKQLKTAQRAEEITELAKAVPAVTERYRLECRSVERLLDEPAGTVDLIITDPPYQQEFVPLYGELVRGAAHVLKPGGLLLCMSGQSWLPEIFAQLKGSLEYLWTMAYLTPGGQATQVFPRKVNTFWKPILVFCQGAYLGDWYGDVTKSDVNDNDKQHHHWGQSASGMRDLMRRFVVPGHVVMDPFLGGGTTALVALELGATFSGFDIDQHAIDATCARLSGR